MSFGAGRVASGATDLTTATQSTLVPAGMGTGDLFYGMPTESARRWWKSIIRNHGTASDGSLKSAATILEEVDQRLRGEAAHWADSNPIAKRILAEDNLPAATTETLNEFKEHFMQRFKVVEVEELEPYQAIEGLKQGVEESLGDYYNRCGVLLKQLGATDPPDEGNTMAKSLLKMVVTKFVAGLSDAQLQTRMAGYPYSSDCGLKGAYTKAQSELRKMQAQQEMIEKNRQQEELSLLHEMQSFILQGKPVPQYLARQLRGLSNTSSQADSVAESTSMMQALTVQPSVAPVPSQTQATNTGPPARQPTAYERQRPQDDNATHTEAGYQANSQQPRMFAPIVLDPNYDFSRSTNAIVRGEQQYRFNYNSPLCYRCGINGHLGRDCENAPLPRQERDFLLKVMNESRQRAQEAKGARAQNSTLR